LKNLVCGPFCFIENHTLGGVNCKDRDLEHIELQAKLPDYFLRSNKSNINLLESRRWPNMAFVDEKECLFAINGLIINLKGVF